METEKPKRAVKRLWRSASEDPEDFTFCLKRLKNNVAETLAYELKSPATKYFHRPFNSEESTDFSIKGQTQSALQMSKCIIPSFSHEEFLLNYRNLIDLLKKIINKKKPEPKEKKESLSLIEDKLKLLSGYFSEGIKDFKFLSTITHLKEQKIRNYWLKFCAEKSILKDYRSAEKLLKSNHCQFIEQYFAKQDNFDKTIFDLHSEMKMYFGFDHKFISTRTLYDYVHSLRISHKLITYKVNTANTPKVKEKRILVAKDIVAAHISSYDFIYIDEASFNLEMRARRGWAKRGNSIYARKPPKSKNYSVISALDSNGMLGIKIVRGGVKGPEFIAFMFDLCKGEEERLSKKKVVFMMDNASIHRSKLFMGKFVKYYNVIYNAPYTPQFNPIELSFSKLKYMVRKLRPRTEKDLVKKILDSCNMITTQECCEFIVHALSFIDNAIAKEDFY